MSLGLSNKRFKVLHSFKGGHKLFLDVPYNRIAIADRSGGRPDQTDDGVLWLHPERVDGRIRFQSERSGQLCGAMMGEAQELVFAMLLGLLETTTVVNAIYTLHELKALSHGVHSGDDGDTEVA